MKTETCELKANCEFFKNESLQLPDSILSSFKKKYCFNCKDACAIYMIACSAGLEYIPAGLFPNEYDKSLHVIANHHN